MANNSQEIVVDEKKVKLIEAASELGTEKALEERDTFIKRLGQRDPSLLRQAGYAGVRSLPYVGGTIGGILADVPGAALGGIAGESARGLIEERLTGKKSTPAEAALGLAEAGVEQGAFQAGGEYVLGPMLRGATRLLKPAAGDVAGKAVSPEEIRAVGQRLRLSSPEIAGQTGLGRIGRGLQTVGEVSVSGQAIAESAKDRIVGEANKLADETLAKIAAPRSPAEGGAQVKSGLEIARDSFRARGELYYGNVERLGENAQGNASPIIAEARKIEGEIPKPLQRTGLEVLGRGGRRGVDINFEDLPENVRSTLQQFGGGGTPLPQATNSQRILTAMKSLKPNATFVELLDTKRYLDQFLPGVGNGIADTEAQGLAKHFEGMLYTALTDSAEKQGGALKDAWNQARNFWRTGRQIYDNKVIVGMFLKNPEELVKSIQPGDVTDINLVKKALLGHGGLPESSGIKVEKYPTATSPQKAWDIFRRQYVQIKLLEEPEAGGFGLKAIEGLKGKMNNAGKSQLNSLFNTDPKGREVLQNLRALAETGSRIKPIFSGNWRRVTELLGAGTLGTAVFAGHGEAALGGIAAMEGSTSLLSGILYSKTATRLLTRGLELSANGSAQGVAMVERAIALAQKPDLTKPIKIEETQ